MNNSRRDFVKKMTAGTAGISIGGINLGSALYPDGNFYDPKSSIDSFLSDNGKFSPVFPVPREAVYKDDFFKLTPETAILIPAQAGKQDRFLSQLMVAELSEKYGIIVPVRKVTSLSGLKNYILMGTVNNPLVQSFAAANKIPVSTKNPGKEGYFLKVSGTGICIAGSDDQGAFYGFQSLRQLLNIHKGEQVMFADIKDWPHMSFRGIRLNIPGPDNLIFYKRFVRDFMAYFKYNKVIMEVNAVMRFDRHPELNAGWLDLARDMDYARRRQSIPGPNGEGGDSVHQDAGDGRILEKEQVADLINYADKYYIETIPEITSLPHCTYLLTRHRELAENRNSQWPDTYCPSNPGSYELYFDVLDEYIEVMKPKMINIGHDEWRMPLNECERCKGKDYSELYAQDVQKTHKYLKDRNIRTAMWGDHLLETVRGKGPQTRKLPSGYTYQMPGGLRPEVVVAKIPKDILVLNWFWKSFKGPGEKNTQQIQEWGFEQIYGNFEPYINDFARRSKVKGIIGGAPSIWSATTELTVGKNKLYKLLGCANLMWSTHYQDEYTLAKNIQELVPSVRTNLKGTNPPSRENNKVLPLDISSCFNATRDDKPEGIPLGSLRNGMMTLQEITFDLPDPRRTGGLCAVIAGTDGKTRTNLTRVSKAITVNRDVSSLIFLHTTAHPSTNIYGHNKIHSYQDTADLLGWYKVIYDDGYVHAIPLRFGVNIREWHIWGINPLTGKMDECLEEPFCNGIGSYCYEGDLLNCSVSADTPINFFAFEWRNPRFGTVIREVYLEGSQQYIDYSEQVIESNAVALIAMSFTEKREIGRDSARTWRS